MHVWKAPDKTALRAAILHPSSVPGPANAWDVSAVEDMSGLCAGTSFNEPIDRWDVSSVRSMDRMFENARAFNQPIGAWKVGQVRSMVSMFRGASRFNQDLGDWDVSSVEDASHMFHGAVVFATSIRRWNIRGWLRATSMFERSAYPYPLILEWQYFTPGVQASFLPTVIPLFRFLADHLAEVVCREPRLFVLDWYPATLNHQILALCHPTTLQPEMKVTYHMVRPGEIHLVTVKAGTQPFANTSHLYHKPIPQRELDLHAWYHDADHPIASTRGNYGKYAVGMLCAFARHLGREVTLEVMDGRRNARAYCLYARFGLHFLDTNTGFGNYLYPMTTSYAADHISLEAIVAVITGRTLASSLASSLRKNVLTVWWPARTRSQARKCSALSGWKR
jgi:hypothetical protein